MAMLRQQIIGVLFCLATVCGHAQEQNVYPEGIGWINVKERYGAKGDGITDDTEALRRAVQERNEIYLDRVSLYLPDGIYLVRDTLTYRNGYYDCCVSIQGQSQAGTIIRLAPFSPGYGDSLVPKPVLFTRAGNQSFHQNLRNLTIDIAEGNPGAVAVDYIANNTGVIRDVTIRAAEGSGHTALAMDRAWPGPALISHVSIRGFHHGVTLGTAEYSMTFEHVSIDGCRSAGIVNNGNTVIARKVAITPADTAPGYWQRGGFGVFIDSDCSMSVDAGTLFARDVRSRSLPTLRSPDTTIVGPVDEYCSGKRFNLWPSDGATLRLPIQETPVTVVNNDTAAWANIEAYGARPSDPFFVKRVDNEAVRLAFASGRPMVWLPITRSNGSCFGIDTHIVVPPHVRLITGFDQSKFCFFDDATLVVEGDTDEPLFVERMDRVRILHRGRRPVVLKDIGIEAYENVPGAGDVFLENVVGAFTPSHATRMWARQFNPEIQPADALQHRNNGGSAWILGMKTEGFAHMTVTTAGGATEVLGGLVYPAQSHADTIQPVAWIVDNARLSTMHTMTSYVPNGWYPIAVRETRGSETRELPVQNLTWPHLALYSTGHAGTLSAPTTPNEQPVWSIERRNGMLIVNGRTSTDALCFDLLGRRTTAEHIGPLVVLVRTAHGKVARLLP
jgi:hypothetical protein